MHEAKTRLLQLVKEVEAGGEVVITRNGQPVVRLSRVEQPFGRGRGAMRERGRVTDLSWDDVVAGDEELAAMFDSR